MLVCMITTVYRHAEVAVIEFLTVHLGLLSREQLLLEEKKRHGCCCLVAPCVTGPGVFAMREPYMDLARKLSPEI